jgi:hypothetical protein
MPDIKVLPAHFPIPGMGVLPINAFVLKAGERMNSSWDGSRRFRQQPLLWLPIRPCWNSYWPKIGPENNQKKGARVRGFKACGLECIEAALQQVQGLRV